MVSRKASVRCTNAAQKATKITVGGAWARKLAGEELRGGLPSGGRAESADERDSRSDGRSTAPSQGKNREPAVEPTRRKKRPSSLVTTHGHAVRRVHGHVRVARTTHAKQARARGRAGLAGATRYNAGRTMRPRRQRTWCAPVSLVRHGMNAHASAAREHKTVEPYGADVGVTGVV